MDAKTLEKKKLPELKALAKSMNIKGFSKMTKLTLIEALSSGGRLLLPPIALASLSAPSEPSGFVDSNGREWVPGASIGKGGWGSIYGCRNNLNVVIKVALEDRPLTDEIDVYTNVPSSPYIPKFYGHGVTPKKEQFIVIEKFDTDFQNWLVFKGRKGQSFNTVILSILEGLEHLHNHGYVHNDIKANNILMNKTAVSLTDFSLATRVDSVWPPIVVKPKRAPVERDERGRKIIRTVSGTILSSDISFGRSESEEEAVAGAGAGAGAGGEVELKFDPRNKMNDLVKLGTDLVTWQMGKEIYLAYWDEFDDIMKIVKDADVLKQFFLDHYYTGYPLVCAYFKIIWSMSEKEMWPNYEALKQIFR